MVDNWIEHIELRRSVHSKLTVCGTKCGDSAKVWRQSWGGWDKVEDLTSPSGARDAINGCADLLGSEIEWLEAVPLIASVDWITAAVIAKLDGHHVPRLPQIVTLLEQRSLRGLGRVKISVEWGGDLHELQLPFERWIRILCGESWVTKETYWYEGERFIARWYFNERHGLEVTYDGGGVGWEGDLHGIDVIAGLQLDGVDLAMLALAAAPPV